MHSWVQGKERIMIELNRKFNFTEPQCRKIVNLVLQKIKEALKEGKVVDVPPLGKLRVVSRTQHRVRRSNPRVGHTIVTFPKHKKTVRWNHKPQFMEDGTIRRVKF